MDEFFKWIGFVFGIIFLSIVVIGVYVIIAFFISKASCINYGEITGKQSKFDFFSGCYVMVGNEFIHRDDYRAKITAENLKQE